MNTSVLVLMAAVTNDYIRLGDLELQKLFFFTVLETRSLKSECWQVCTPSEGFRGEFFLASFSSWWLQVYLVCGYVSPVSLPPPSLLCVSVFSSSFLRVLLTRFRAYLGDLM